MNLNKDKLLKVKGYYEGNIDAVDPETARVVIDYKKNVCKNYIALSPDQIESRVAGKQFFITRKYDGEMSIIFFNGTDTFTINTGGKVRMGIPCIEETGKYLKKAGIKSAIIPAELFVCEKDGRTRVFDVLSTLSKEEKINDLCIAPFDIIEINGSNMRANLYEEVHQKLGEIFAHSEMVIPVAMKKASSKSEVSDMYIKWVEEEGSEGIVLRSELPLVYKIKPKHNLDAVVVGYTEGSGDLRGQIRTLLLALMTGENRYQIIGRTGNGFKEDEKKQIYERLSKATIESEYIDIDSNHVAFRMVKPETVIELSYNDVILESSSSKIRNPVLKIENERYSLESFVNGVSLIFPIFERIREDKNAVQHNVRIEQITDIFYAPDVGKGEKTAELPKSEIILRDVYKKETKGKLMVQKFIVWKTNKESIDESYPAYVMHYTNFSSDRKEHLQRDMRISNSREQIMQFVQYFIEKNIKKGWERV
ncbi:UNVERIFIED_CONTAM: ATP dependent DNA ligase-like protein [Acetivibrio alkalicellulosi]